MNRRGGAAVLLVLIGVGLLGAVLLGMIRPAEPAPVAAIELRPKRSAEWTDRPSFDIPTRSLESITEARPDKGRKRIGGVDDAGSGVEEDDLEKGVDDSGGDDSSPRDDDLGRKGADDADDDGSVGEDDLDDDGHVGEEDDEKSDDGSVGEDDDGEDVDDADDAEHDD
jgi:hypothetical protein